MKICATTRTVTLLQKGVGTLLQQQSREDVIDPDTGEPIIRAGRKISRSAVRRLLNSSVGEVPIAEVC